MSGLCLDPAHSLSLFAGVSCTRETWYAVEGVLEERNRQKAKWGTPEDPHDTADRHDGTGRPDDRRRAAEAQATTDRNAELGIVTWRDILEEELREAFAETDRGLLRAELIQVAAVAVKWVEALDRRAGDS